MVVKLVLRLQVKGGKHTSLVSDFVNNSELTKKSNVTDINAVKSVIIQKLSREIF